ncbi:E3 ISG15--protein ligase HERC5 [Camelus ferus]|nr:E3 ISG15--protein ligase HERC5 [Camelus ferus]
MFWSSESADGQVFSWGKNIDGQLGLGSEFPSQASPQRDGKVFTFGDNSYGQLGHSPTAEKRGPQLVERIEGLVSQIECGSYHTLAYVYTTGQVVSFGRGPSCTSHSPHPGTPAENFDISCLISADECPVMHDPRNWMTLVVPFAETVYIMMGQPLQVLKQCWASLQESSLNTLVQMLKTAVVSQMYHWTETIQSHNNVKVLLEMMKEVYKVEFIKEIRSVGEGVKSEFFHCIFEEMTKKEYGMFIYPEEGSCMWFPTNPKFEKKRYFLFGMLCGLSLYNLNVANLPFPLALFKKLLDQKPSLEDLKELNPVLGKKDYVSKYVDYIFNTSVMAVYEEFQRGFHKVCDKEILKYFQPEELMTAMVGNTDYDWEQFEQNSSYIPGYHKSHHTILMFWKAFHKLTLDEKIKFLYKDYPALIEALDNQTIEFLACGGSHSALLTKDGLVFTFGAGKYGQLGHNSTQNELKPCLVTGLVGNRVTQIACGRRHTLAFVSDLGKVFSFGSGKEGQLGNGGTHNQLIPLPMKLSSNEELKFEEYWASLQESTFITLVQMFKNAIVAQLHYWNESAENNCHIKALLEMLKKLHREKKLRMCMRLAGIMGREGSPLALLPTFNLTVRRNHLIEDALNQLNQFENEDLRRELLVSFSGEIGYDFGGVRAEFFHCLFKEMTRPEYGLFTYPEEASCMWFPVKPLFEKKSYFFFGVLCGLCLFNCNVANIPFPLALFKKLLDQTPSLEDLKELSPVLGKRDYVSKYVNYIFNISVKAVYEEFQRGFYKVCDKEIIEFFHPEELKDVIIGNTDYDWETFEKNAHYAQGYDNSHPTIVMFWKALHKLTLEEKKKFLGTDRIQVKGLQNMKITFCCPENLNERDPIRAQTCFSVLYLPKYSTMERVEEALQVAINNNRGFG